LPNVPREELASASINASTGWDSLATVNILALIEEEFSIHVPEADMENFTSFQLVLAYLTARPDVAKG
jgi:acyl carrier protein